MFVVEGTNVFLIKTPTEPQTSRDAAVYGGRKETSDKVI